MQKINHLPEEVSIDFVKDHFNHRGRHQSSLECNCSHVVFPRKKNTVDLFEEQVKNMPNETAAIFDMEKLSYEELNNRSNQVAHLLKSFGLKKEALVPICLERSLEMLIGMLGILKAGGAYVPIDPEYPAERIHYILKDTNASVIISSSASKSKLSLSGGVEVIELDNHNVSLCSMSCENPKTIINPKDLAYVIYTSGSTGKPKGVLIEHEAIADHCFGLIKVAQLESCRSFALFSPLVFDAGHSIIFTSLFLGASLNILSKELIVDGEKLVNYLKINPVDCIKIVPSVWLSYINGENNVLADKVMIFGGETFSPKIQQHLLQLNYRGIVYNHYGPTEATIGKCIHKVNLNKHYKTIPIGKPFSNTQLYVVDEFDQLVPAGTAGELYIAGVGIARGYLNRPELSAEKFIKDPFVKSESRVYKTGDKVKWNDDGEIEYLGRIDEQVKVRGHRIEPGEIENALLQNKNIKQAAVRLIEDTQGNKNLVGYIVPKDSFDKEEVIKHLKEALPDYMVPGLWVKLESLPLTSNGKIDKKALPVPDISQLLTNPYSAATNDAEAALIKIWQSLLNVEKIGIYDSFFELGGNSIQAVTMFTRVRKHFRRDLPLATIFEAPNVNKLAAIISKKDNLAKVSCLVPIQPHGANPPLFCIHAGAGNVLFYKDLSKNLGTEQPLYGLMARGLNGQEPFHTSIEDMAAYYIKEIQSVQPRGPYYLAGYCLGGIIAFDMAQQLLKTGEKVELLALFNSRSPTYLNLISANNKTKRKTPTLFLATSTYAGNFSAGKSKDKLIYPIKWLKICFKLSFKKVRNKVRNKLLKTNRHLLKMGFDYYLSKDRLLPRFLRNRYLLYMNQDMSKAYNPQDYPGKMLIFNSPHLYKDPFLGWKEHVSGMLESINVPGKYRLRNEIMEEPYVKDISEKLKILLRSNIK